VRRAEPAPGRGILAGTLRVTLADALLFPTGMLTVAFLTRRLGPDGYGLYSLAAVLVAWIEWTITSMFARAAVKFVSEAEDWRPVGAMVARLHLWTSAGAAALLWVFSGQIAALLAAPGLDSCLRLFALDIPSSAMPTRTDTC